MELVQSDGTVVGPTPRSVFGTAISPSKLLARGKDIWTDDPQYGPKLYGTVGKRGAAKAYYGRDTLGELNGCLGALGVEVLAVMNLVKDYATWSACQEDWQPGLQDLVIKDDDLSGELSHSSQPPLQHLYSHSKVKAGFRLPCIFHACGRDNYYWPALWDFPNPIQGLDGLAQTLLIC